MNNYSLAEAYVMGRMNREKLKKEEERQKAKKISAHSSPNYEPKQRSSWILRKMKIHPSNADSKSSI
ncbi:unnamed protein product, partial [Citrullus colocynthis]